MALILAVAATSAPTPVVARAPCPAPSPAAIALGVSPGVSPGGDASKAVKAFKDSWRDGPGPVTLARLQELSGHDDPRSVEVLLDVFAKGHAALQPTAREVLGSFHAAKSLSRLETKAIHHRSPAVRRQVLLMLGESRPGDRDWRGVIEAALDDDDSRVRAAAVRSAGRVRADGRLDRVLALAGDADAVVRAEVAGCLVRLVGARSLPVLDALSSDARWRVRLAALEGYRDLKSRVGVERLVGRLEAETGRLREDALLALQRLTGRNLGADPADWRGFLADAPDDFLALADTVALKPARYAGGITYHDVASASRRFVCATDLSNSMGSRGARVDGYAGEDARLSIAITELARLLASLDTSHRFNLITFSNNARAWRRAPVAADTKGLQAAKAEIRDYRPNGGTNVHAALELAFAMADASARDAREADHDIDTLFLLTDGAPTVGELTDTRLLLESVRERNRDLRLRIHCISLAGSLADPTLLRALATETGGHYVEKVR